MHQTTIRFGDDLWARLDAAADAAGVSVAQYVREAAVRRLDAAGSADGPLSPSVAATDRARRRDAARASRAHARVAQDGRTTHTRGEESSAVWAQARQARRRAASLREDAVRLREQHLARGAAARPADGPDVPTQASRVRDAAGSP